jgi:hypothetical protein
VAVRQLPLGSTVGGRLLDRGLWLRAGVPIADACALAAAVVIAGAAPWTIAYAAIVFLALHLDPARSGRIDPRLSTDAGWLLARAAVPLVALMPAAAASGAGTDWPTLCAVAAASLLLGRSAAYAIVRRARAAGTLAEPTIIVGSGEVADHLAEILAEHPEYGMRLVGSADTSGRRVGTVPMLGDPRDLGTLIEDHGVRRVLIAFGVSERELVASLRSAERTSAEFHVVPRLGIQCRRSGSRQRGRALDDPAGPVAPADDPVAQPAREAVLRRRGGEPPAAADFPVAADARGGGQALEPRPDPVPSEARRSGRRAVRDLEVPIDARDRRLRHAMDGR